MALVDYIDINNIDQLLNIIKVMIDQNGPNLWYRGIADREMPLIPSIQRYEHRKKVERYITNDFYIRAKQVLEKSPEKKNYAAWMSLMQHFGLPTRLLDWSKSPLIAAFFATEKYLDYPQKDACIWVLDPGSLNQKEGFGNCIYPVDALTVQDMLEPAFKESGNNLEVSDKIIACYSTDNNLRMYSQQSCFTIHNSEKRLVDICDRRMLCKLRIPSERREYFLNSIQVFGITEGFIYPDLDHISNDLKKVFGLL